MNSTPTTERVTHADLRDGDVVWTGRLRVRIGQRRTFEMRDQLVINFQGEILNPEYLRTDEGRYLYGGIIPLDGSSGWTIQGTDWLPITREA